MLDSFASIDKHIKAGSELENVDILSFADQHVLCSMNSKINLTLIFWTDQTHNTVCVNVRIPVIRDSGRLQSLWRCKTSPEINLARSVFFATITSFYPFLLAKVCSLP